MESELYSSMQHSDCLTPLLSTSIYPDFFLCLLGAILPKVMPPGLEVLRIPTK